MKMGGGCVLCLGGGDGAGGQSARMNEGTLKKTAPIPYKQGTKGPCGDLNEKWPPQSQASEDLVPGWPHYVVKFRRCALLEETCH